MAGIPSDLLIPLRKALAECEQFARNKTLIDLFTDDRLKPFRNNLPETDGRSERVNSTISYLHEKNHSNGSNALVSLLLVLAESMDDGDARQKELNRLAAQLAGTGTAVSAPPQPAGLGRSDVPAGRDKPAPTERQAAQGKPDAAPPENRDFFISYNRYDKDWAEWIAWQLENEGYTTFIQAWDFREGGNFVARMQEAAEKSKRTIAVLSETYLASKFARSEWNAAFAQDPTGEEGLLLPVRVRECDPKGLLSSIVYIDLLGLSAGEARERLLEGIKQGRAKPLEPPNFPGTVTRAEPPLPGSS
jgi:hypothetical protein